MQCTRCGKEMFTSSTSSSDNYCFECQTNKPNTGRLSNCDMPFPSFGKQEGWICPVCGRGLSPWTSFCPCQSDIKITYGTGTLNLVDDDSAQYRTNCGEDIKR